MKKLILATLLTILCGGSFVHAEGYGTSSKSSKTSSTAPKMEWTALQRENMAKMHENMASCLRSKSTMSDCRAQMRTSCTEMGQDGCPMMMKGKGHGMMWEE